MTKNQNNELFIENLENLMCIFIIFCRVHKFIFNKIGDFYYCTKFGEIHGILTLNPYLLMFDPHINS